MSSTSFVVLLLRQFQNLKPKSLMIVDDQEAYSTAWSRPCCRSSRRPGSRSITSRCRRELTDFSSIIAKVTPSTSVVVLPWQVASNAQQLGRDLAQQHKKAVIFGTDGLFSPGTFTIDGSYVSSFGPDIHGIAADAPIVARPRRPRTSALRHVRPAGVRGDARAGRGHQWVSVRPDPTRANVLAAVKATNESTSILGQSIQLHRQR